MKLFNKKGYSLAELAPIAITLVVVAIILSFGSSILHDVRDEQSGNSSDPSVAWNASDSGLEGLTTVADWLPTIALIVVAAIIIGIIVTYFKFR